MRLTCPNCTAAYDIDAGLIAPDGREVQCSECGHTWFQNSGEVRNTRMRLVGRANATRPGLAPPDDVTTAADGTDGPDTRDASESMADARQGAPDEGGDDDVGEDASDDDDTDDAADGDDDAGGADGLAPALRPRPVDAAALAILREEAAREAAARRADAKTRGAGPDRTPDPEARRAAPPAPPAAPPAPPAMSLEPTVVALDETAGDASTGTGRRAGPPVDGRTTIARGGRRLPDAEALSSSLTTADAAAVDRAAHRDRGPDRGAGRDRDGDHRQPRRRRTANQRARRSIGSVLLAVVMIAVAAAVLTYVFAPQIAATFPGIADELAAYRAEVGQALARIARWANDAGLPLPTPAPDTLP